MRSDNLVRHLEEHLGQIEAGYTTDDRGRPMPFHIVRYGSMVAGGVAFSTLGLSRHRFPRRASGQFVRHELLMIAPEREADWVTSVLLQVGQEALESQSARPRGSVVGPLGGTVTPGTKMNALYVALPVYLPDEFAVVVREDGERVVIPWLFPIHHAEAHFVLDNGWRAFEDKLINEDPDLVQWSRPSII